MTQKAEEQKDMVSKVPTVRAIGKYKFSDGEKAQMSKEFCTKQIDKEILESEKKSTMANYKDRIDKIQLDIRKLSRCVYDGYEMREFVCTVERDFEDHLKRFKDVHTGEIVDERPLDPSDYQQKMDFSQDV